MAESLLNPLDKEPRPRHLPHQTNHESFVLLLRLLDMLLPGRSQ